jgi:hypothetical protein
MVKRTPLACSGLKRMLLMGGCPISLMQWLRKALDKPSRGIRAATSRIVRPPITSRGFAHKDGIYAIFSVHLLSKFIQNELRGAIKGFRIALT